MRVYSPIRVGSFTDPKVQKEMQKVDTYLRQLSTQTARTPAAAQGTPVRTTQSVTFDTKNYLYLPGRNPYQWAHGPVQFDARGSADAAVIPNSFETCQYMVLRAKSLSGGNYFVDSVNFQIETSGVNRHTEWIIPSVATQATFASTTSAQTIGNKTFQTCTITVGTAAGRCIFSSSDTGLQQFFIAPNTGFPTTGVSTPTLRIPSLDTSSDLHSFVMLHSNNTAPYPPGSVIYGNSAGTEMASLANGSAGDVLTSGGGTAAPSWSSPSGLTYLDSTFRISDDGDTTKKIAFEASGITTATTRTITMPDSSGTAILSTGPSSGGQRIGSSPTKTNGTQYDVCIDGRFASGDAGSATWGLTSAHRWFDVRANAIDRASIFAAFQQTFGSGNTTNPAGGTFTTLLMASTGTPAWTGGSFNYRAFNAQAAIQVPNNATAISIMGGIFQVTPAEISNGFIDILGGLQTSVSTPAVGTHGLTATALICHDAIVSSSDKPITDVWGFRVRHTGTPGAGAIANFYGVELGAGTTVIPFNQASVTTWYGFYISATTMLPTKSYGVYVGIDNLNTLNGLNRFGSTTDAAHFVDIAAGTTAVAPIHFTAGTNLTTAAAGCVEYDGSNLFITHGDAVRTKAVTQRGQVDATAQAAAIGTTTIYSPPAAGYYVVHYTIACTTADAAAGTIQFQANYTDDIGATNQTGAALALTVTGRDRGSFEVYSASGVISYATNLTGIIGTSKYALRVRLEYLG